MIPTSVNGQGSTQTAATATIGIASLILEGRALSEDDFVTTGTTTDSSRVDFQSRKLVDDQKLSTYLSRSPNISNANSEINFGYFSPPSESSTVDPTLQHMQRLRQKLGQLRQSSPSTSSSEHMSAEQAIAIGLNNRWNNTVTTPNEDEDENALVQYLQRKQTTNRFVNPIAATLQSLATTCLRTASPRSNKVLTEPNEPFFGSSRVASGAGSCSNLKASTSSSGLENVIPKTIKSPPTRSADKGGTPKQGPHCDQFLRKVGLTKADASVDMEEHICDMTNLNEICYRWQIHCRQIDFIMSTMDPICIEVYLGPENHEILLEQWIIQQKEKSTTPTMTIQSLSNAIRSQLYFSQITAWTDLIKNAKPNDRDIIEHGRIKLVEKIVNGTNARLPRLDIFYRIRAYDATACFNSKPNVHDFPNIVISENCSISVCLKSLPRIQNGIPRINFVDSENTNNPNNASCNSSSNVNNNSYNSSSHITHAASKAICSETSPSSSTEQSSSSIEDSMVLDDRLDVPCQEKGKHRCAFDDEEYASSDTVIEGMSSADLSHREKQLLKYRKRMMKRDKKSKMTTAANGVNTGKAANDVTASTFSRESLKSEESLQREQVHNDNTKQRHVYENLTRTPPYQLPNQHQPTGTEFGSINSYRPPLYRTQQMSIAEAVQTNSVEMISTGTQTPSFPLIFACCDNCGSEMELICPRCDSSKDSVEESTSTHKHCNQFVQQSKITDSVSVRSAVSAMGRNTTGSPTQEKNEGNNGVAKLGKGDLLLQAIERASRHRFFSDTRNNNNNNSSSTSSVTLKTKANDCQLCKRQKTQHVYRSMMETENDYVESPTANREYDEYLYSKLVVMPGYEANEAVDHHMSNDCACSDEYGENCCLKSNLIAPHPIAQKLARAPASPHELKLSDDIDAQFKTPKAGSVAPVKLSPKNQQKPTPLFINCSEKFAPAKSIPKINLTNVFSGSPSTTCVSAPIPILSSEASILAAAFSFDNINNSPDIPVQKSNSAPTLPNSPSLSPRFLKQAAIYKRRSRHLSDRSSERSSIGSDEQFSDEDLESLYSPTSSPIKTRMFLKSSGFGKRPLLGSLEESLLQKRLVPKSQVAGYKVLLGASGGFCPTQLTIPAISSFYELSNSSTLSTPYVCEIRLSRKGYTVPRVGTIQATLLNPLGTVVRMFVVPYDFRDMPAMSQTFIRQRVLAVGDNDSIGKDNGDSKGLSMKQLTPGTLSGGNLSGLKHSDVSFGEQMRTLRYAIHLRFQTSRSGRLALHTDIRLLISRRTDCDTAAAHAKGALESPNELRIVTIKPENPKYSSRQENPNKI